MRLLLGLVLLLSLFTLAMLWQGRVTESAAARGPTTGDSASLARPYGSDWTRLVVGAPSGAEAVLLAPPLGSSSTPVRVAPAHLPAAVAVEPPAREFELIVRRGQTLSAICQAHYQTARPSLVEAVARYNKLSNAASVREGQRLALPPIESLNAAQH